MLPPCAHDPEGLALLMACKENPLDLAPRLILTDWLEDQGEEDVACCLRESMAHDGCMVPLPTHVQERWQPLNGCDHGWLCLRPVADTVERKLDELRDCRWFCSISLTDLSETLARKIIRECHAINQVVRLATMGYWTAPEEPCNGPRLDWMSDLTFNSPLIEESDVLALSQNSFIKPLSLTVGDAQHHRHGMRALFEAAWLPNLRQLRLGGELSCWVDFARYLTRKKLNHLESLSLGGPGGRMTLQAIIHDQAAPQLRRLALRNMGIDAEDILSEFPRLASRPLESLDLSGNPLRCDGLRAIVIWPGLSSLKELCLRRIGCKSAALAELASSRQSANIRILDVSDNRGLDEEHLNGLESATMPVLEKLRMSDCELTAASMARLVESGLLRSISSLDLSKNRIGKPGVRHLANAGPLKITELDMSENFIGEGGLIHLAGYAGLQQVTRLGLDGNGITPRGLAELAFSPHVSSLRHLWINNNNLIGDYGIRHLTTSAWLPGLQELSIIQTGITDTGLRALVDSPNLGELQSLNLWGNPITDAGADMLANCEALKSLTDLCISQEHLTDRGMNALRNSPYLQHTIIHW
ncbi:hypothetical protein [Zavarzinella formosa]|uniref:hypothetical protein n=1 Tax=Zavarzinella formosa TaxID=360055 RepID=UPI00030F3CD9|nr:hypothetical protein [Zavarzinella formosa]